ncbi:MAG: sulfite exporter TauE/SafE family protein [Oscillospiraceae bacterium]|nr:sulfite exporter TauE/SafE family protein [Oscillospiraceae bacterium]
MDFLIAVLAGVLAGVLSGFGVGGGTLLLIYMAVFAGIRQQTAQGINLLYFLPTSLASLYFHIKNGFIEKKAILPAVLSGVCLTAVSAFFATGLDVSVLKKCFGVFLLITGAIELFGKSRPIRK